MDMDMEVGVEMDMDMDMEVGAEMDMDMDMGEGVEVDVETDLQRKIEQAEVVIHESSQRCAQGGPLLGELVGGLWAHRDHHQGEDRACESDHELGAEDEGERERTHDDGRADAPGVQGEGREGGDSHQYVQGGMPFAYVRGENGLQIAHGERWAGLPLMGSKQPTEIVQEGLGR